MDLIYEIEIFTKKYPTRQFCLHNGFAGFSYGCPSNPLLISKIQAIDYLSKYYTKTGNNPIEIMESKLFTLLFDDAVPELYKETGYRMLGFNTKDECLYGDSGLG